MTKQFILLLMAAPVLLARPVSYPGGTTLLVHGDHKEQAIHWHYSPTAHYSIGVRQSILDLDQSHRTHVQANFLLHRENRVDSQANLYLKSGFGFANPKGGGLKLKGASFMNIAFDWEDQRYYLSAETGYSFRDRLSEERMQSYRFGFAPYVAQYGALHTWIMVQVDRTDGVHSDSTVTPLLRFFKGEHLFELGYSNRDTVMLNYIRRF